MSGAEQYEYDLFISYSSHNKSWVRGELLERLENAGVKVCIDFRDFTRGAPSIKEMSRAIKSCRRTLAVLTPEYVQSEWCEIEHLMTAVLGPANRDLRLIPLLKAECENPLHIGALTHVDFTEGANQELAWRQLLTALGRPPEPVQPPVPQRDGWLLAHPYPMPPNFTGRAAERAMLDSWLNEDCQHPLLSIRALGGFGKSALVWHWLTHDVRPTAWPRVVWWSFYEADASFEQFVAESLRYLSGDRIDLSKIGGKNAVLALLNGLREPGTLLVLDGFERVLRAFGGLNAAYQGDESNREDRERDCISPLAETFLYHLALLPGLRSKVLLTTRLSPHILDAKGGRQLAGSREVELRQLQPADAVGLFEAQGIRGTHTEIETACERYGYHPLSLRLLAGLIISDFQQPGDIAAANRLDVSGDLVQRQHHVLQTAYESLTPERQTLLGWIACYRSPVSYEMLKGIAESGNAVTRGPETKRTKTGSKARRKRKPGASPLRLMNLDADLRDLISRGLVHHDVQDRRFDLHPIVRRYAYDRLAAPDRAAAHTQLRDYFAAVPKPEKVTRLEDLAPVIELYHHTVSSGQLDEACDLFRKRLHAPLYYQLGAYHLQIDLLRSLFPDGEDCSPRLKKKSDQGWTLNSLALSYGLSGQPHRAIPLYEQVNEISKMEGDKVNLAIGLGNLACMAQIHIGQLRATESNLRRSLAVSQEIKEEIDEAIVRRELGWLLAYRGADIESETELATALAMFEKEDQLQMQGSTWACRARRELLLLRADAVHQAVGRAHLPVRKSRTGKRARPTIEAALTAARRALELADEMAREHYPVERDYVQAHWLLGAAHRVAGQLNEAEQHLHEALERCRRINLVEVEADILIDLARLRAATGAADEAQRLAEEAQLIADRSGYVLQGADAYLELAKLAFARGDRATAREHAQTAHRLATCDGPPDYTYAAAYAEATALLEQL